MKNKFFIIVIILISISSSIGCSKIPAAKADNSKTLPPEDYKPYSSKLPLPKDNININFQGKDLKLQLPIYIKANRYYIPLNELANKLSMEYSLEKDSISITYNHKNINFNYIDNIYTENNKNVALREKVILDNKIIYIPLFELCKMFNFKTDWELDKKTIKLFDSREKMIVKNPTNGNKTALLRLEDIGPGSEFINEDSLEKLRLMADYLFSENVPFHIAWVPRYVEPGAKIDNDPATQYSMCNADFIFTTDYLLDRNGIIGLHGYTHQHGNSISFRGTEFHMGKNDNIPASEQYAAERMDNAINAAKQLDIPFKFFEAPHYAILPTQMKAAEDRFNLIYQPYSTDGGVTECKYIFERKLGSRTVKYIPTPLDYVKNKNDIPNMIKKIDSLKPDMLRSLFYHPWIEFQDIKITRDNDGYPSYTYSDNSGLHILINHLYKNGYRFQPITYFE
ncbi:MAG: DUF2334 domain-containing protein [Bacillota bacterium]|nr:DUF2334 domain-containing protein [Bacillota bacterium]